MARYLGPIHKKSRKLNFSILENNKDLSSKKFLQGSKKRKRKTDFGLQLEEKQKLRLRYNLSEKQLRNIFVKVLKMKGDKKQNLLLAVESRLDSFVYRVGFASTRRAARQLVSHNHVLLNNNKATIPSMTIQIGDIISIKKDKTKKSVFLINSIKNREKLSYISVDEKNLVAKQDKALIIEELKEDIDLSLVIEYYNRFI